MNPAFSGDPLRPNTTPGLATSLMSLDVDPGLSGGGGGGGGGAIDPTTGATTGGTGGTGGSPTVARPGSNAPSWYTPPPMVARPGDPNRAAYIANWDPNAPQNVGRRRPAADRERGPIASGFDWTRFANTGNLGGSDPHLAKFSDPAWHPPGEPGSTAAQGVSYDDWRASMAQENPWMADTSVIWGGGSGGYLPIDYQAQNYRYYQNTPNLAPWEQKYMQDTWTQNYDRNQPGFVNTNRLDNDPNDAANLRG
jgi:hypothetical protein